ncbi:MAG: AAA family ATPase [Gemmatimonadota bacterium]|nr:AAA family ATPase [Gemmatimonadota bacterium]
MFHGRTRELGLLRTALDERQASYIVVSGMPGAGKTALALHATADFPVVYHRVPPLPESHQHDTLVADVARGLNGMSPPPASGGEVFPTGWQAAFRRLLSAANPEGRPLVLVMDDAHHLGESRARITAPLFDMLTRAREGGLPIHVVLLTSGRTPLPGTLDDDSAEAAAVRLDVLPLSCRAAAPMLPGSTAEDIIQAYAVFGGVPGRLIHLDTGATLLTNIRRTMLAPEAPLAQAGLTFLQWSVQAPARYAAVLASLSLGEADWKTIHEGMPDLTASGQVAPYVKRLEALGAVESRRSLDARPGSRNTRYGLTDPFLAFWYRTILPNRTEATLASPTEFFHRHLRPTLDPHTASVFPSVCRQYMAHDAMESVGSNAREVGSLWSPTMDVPVAGVLRSGVPFYGAASWSPRRPGVELLHDLDRAVGETRYGFGRELRLRVVYARDGFTAELARQAARRRDVLLLTAADVLGNDGA